MKKFSITRTIIRGITLAIPLAIICYVFFKVITVLEKAIAPLAKKVGVLHLFGEITITVIAVLFLFVIFFLLGLLMRLAIVASFRLYIEERILYFIPSLRHLKILADDKLQAENPEDHWKPVLIKKFEMFYPAFIIEETDKWVTFVRVEIPTIKTGKFFIAKKSDVSYMEITSLQMRQFNRRFGKGYIKLIEEAAHLG